MRCNLDTWTEKFELVYDKKYAGGSAWVCKKCGRMASSIEHWLPCLGDFVPWKIACTECVPWVVWKLKFECSEEEQTALNEITKQ